MTEEKLKKSWVDESNAYNEMMDYLINAGLEESELIQFTKLLGTYIDKTTCI